MDTVAVVAPEPVGAVLDQDYYSRKLHLDRQQVTPRVLKGHN